MSRRAVQRYIAHRFPLSPAHFPSRPARCRPRWLVPPHSHHLRSVTKPCTSRPWRDDKLLFGTFG